ncbi:MAG: hypothetical protein ACFFBD_04310 [Candidatus Hodarchaeota archaeon]
MNIGLNAGTVRAHGSPLFNVFLFGKTQYVAIDHLPGPIRDGLDVAIQSRLFKTLVGNADTAESAQTLRVDDVKGQFFIRKAKKDFNDQTTQHLLGTHTLGAGTLGLGFTFVQVLQNIATDGRICINDAADYFKLFALGMIKYVGHQGHLFLPFFAHFVTGSFSVFVVILIGCRLLIYYNKQRIATTKCAFFMIYK